MVDVVHIIGCERSGTTYAQWLMRENFKDILVLIPFKHYEPRGIFPLLDWGMGSQKEKINSSKDIQKKVEDFIYLSSTLAGPRQPPMALTNNKFDPPKFNKKSKDIEKYVRAAVENGTLRFLINIKNPYGWHISYTKNWKKIKFGSEMKHWADLYSEWAKFEDKYPDSTMFIRHEDALKDHKAVLKLVMEKFSLTPSRDDFMRPEMRLGGGTAEIKGRSFKRREYFEKEQYKEDLVKNKRAILDECNKILPRDLMERFGYEIL